MPLVIDDRYLPATLTTGPMTDDQFAEFCAEHEDLRFELTAGGELIVYPVPFNITARREEKLYKQLDDWAESDGRGYGSGSNQWFTLPTGARRVLDAAWVLKSRVAELMPETLGKYWPVCPDFVAEIRSQSDRLPVLRDKMQEWIANGARLAWLIDPERHAVEVYRPGLEPVILTPGDSLAADSPLDGFVLDLRPIWEPLS
jgi:Uma2 family endonuclease